MFESTYLRSKEFYKEIYSHHYFKSGFALVLEILMGISLLGGLLSLIIFRSEPPYTSCVCIVFIVAMRIWSYHRTVKISLAREKEISAGGEIAYTVTVCEDKIIQKTSLGSEFAIDFTSIKKAYKTKNYIVLQSVAKQLYIWKKDSFTVGDCESFKAFLRGKGYKL